LADNRRPAAPRAGYPIEAVERSLAMLRLLARRETPTSLPDAAAALGTTRSTAFRLLWNLEQAGFVRRGDNGGYALGHAVLDLAAAYHAQNPVERVARTHIDQLRDETGETCCLLLREGAERVCVYTAESREKVRRMMPLGTLGPLWRGAAGRILFAFLDPATRAAIVEGQPDTAALEGDAAAVREAGVAVSVRDTAPDVWSVAAPIRGHAGEVVASIACTAPMQRSTSAHMRRCQALTVEAAAAISAALGA